MDKQEISYINNQIEGLISDLESVLINADCNDDTRDIDDAIDGLKDAKRALESIL